MRLPEGLPELRGRWLASYKVLWWIVLALALVGSTAGTWVLFEKGRTQDLAIYGAGLRMEMNSRPFTFAPISPDAREAGIVLGSTLLAVDGRPVSGGGDLAAIDRLVKALEGRDGQVLALRMRAPDGTVAEHRIERGPHHLAAADREAPVPYKTRVAFNLMFLVTTSALGLVAGILLFTRRKREPVVALLSLGLLAFAAAGIGSIFADAALSNWIGWVISSLGTSSLFLALATFPAGRFEPRVSLLIIPLSLSLSVISLPGINAATGEQGVISSISLIFLFAVLALRYLRLPPGVQRQQMKWAVLGLAMLAVAFPLAFILALLDRTVDDNWLHFALLFGGSLLQFLGIFGFVAGLLISLLRYRLYDADAAISRSALYGGMTLFLVAVFAAFGKLFESLGEQYFGDTAGMAAGALAAGVAALLLVPLHNRLSRWAENRFQRDIATMRATLPELLAELRDSENPRNLADDALRLAIRGVRASHGAILFAGGERMELAEASGIGADVVQEIMPTLPEAPEPGLKLAHDVAFPLQLPLLTASGVLTGWLLLGPHPDGRLYGKDDREAREEIASPLARALLLAMDRARRAEARSTETARLRETMDAVAQSLAEIAERIAPARRGPRKAQTIN